MRIKLLAGVMLGLAIAVCPITASLVSAASAQEHSCCPAPAGDSGSDCCLRAAVPGAVTLAAPQLYVIGLAAAAPSLIFASEKTWLESGSLSPPDRPPLASRSSRAPPPSSPKALPRRP